MKNVTYLTFILTASKYYDMQVYDSCEQLNCLLLNKAQTKTVIPQLEPLLCYSLPLKAFLFSNNCTSFHGSIMCPPVKLV